MLKNKIEAPGIVKKLEETIAEDRLKSNWKNVEKKKCGQCNGDPLKRMGCITCDFTGIDYELHYGVEDGKLFAHMIQNGIDPILAVCKERRETEGRLKAEDMGREIFMIPASIELELKAMDYPLDEWVSAGDMRSYGKAVQRHFPKFMTTNMII